VSDADKFNFFVSRVVYRVVFYGNHADVEVPAFLSRGENYDVHRHDSHLGGVSKTGRIVSCPPCHTTACLVGLVGISLVRNG
jgi:hypothetical protein